MEALKKRIDNYYKDFDFEFCKDYILNNCQKEYQEIMIDVNQLMNHTFVFNRKWDMEPCLKPYTIYPLKWDYTPNHDEEWIFMLNRHEFLEKLIIAYIVSGDICYLNKVKEYIMHWIENVTIFSCQNPATRTIDTGIRCSVWLNVLMVMIHFGSIEDDEIRKIAHSIEKQIKFLIENYIDKYSLSNWGILQTTTIISCHQMLQDLINIKKEYEFSLEEIQTQVSLQILEDGTQWEQSIMYHVEVYSSLLKLYYTDQKFFTNLKETLNRMAYYIKSVTGLDHIQLAIGDSDFTDTRDIMTLSAIILKDNQYLQYGYKTVNINTIMITGKPGIQYYHSLQPINITIENHYFEDSGQISIKHNDSFLYFKNGPMSSGHTHSDENSFCLYYQNKPIFVDPGRYTYMEIEKRYSLKSANMHNVCVIDHNPPEIIKDSWDYDKYPQPIYTYFKKDKNSYYIEGSYYDYTVKNQIYIYKRKIVMIEDDIWLVIDIVILQGKHSVSTRFMLDSDVGYENGLINNLKIVSQSEYKAEKSYISKRYNEVEATIQLIKEEQFEDNYIGANVICDKSYEVIEHKVYQVGSVQPLNNAISYEFKNELKNYLVVIINEEIHTGNKLCVVDGIKFRGKCVIYDKKKGIKIRLRS